MEINMNQLTINLLEKQISSLKDKIKRFDGIIETLEEDLRQHVEDRTSALTFLTAYEDSLNAILACQKQ